MINLNTYQNADTEQLVSCIKTHFDQIEMLNDENKYYFYPLIFFEIFVKFQKLIYTFFEKYCLGTKSCLGYCPARKINFLTQPMLRDFLGKRDKEYIDYDDKIKTLSQHIFTDNIFDQLNQMSPLQYCDLVNIRNYIAHESYKSKQKLSNARIISEEEIINDFFVKEDKSTSSIKFLAIIKSILTVSLYLCDAG